jgi:hypothetical protein
MRGRKNPASWSGGRFAPAGMVESEVRHDRDYTSPRIHASPNLGSGVSNTIIRSA